MRLLILIASIAIALPGPAAAARNAVQTAESAAKCPTVTSHHALRKGQKTKPQKLGQLPPANAYAAVYRLENGCMVPVIVRQDVGGRR